MTRKPPSLRTPSHMTIGARWDRSREQRISITPKNTAINPNTCSTMPGCSVGIRSAATSGNSRPPPANTLISPVQKMNVCMEPRLGLQSGNKSTSCLARIDFPIPRDGDTDGNRRHAGAVPAIKPSRRQVHQTDSLSRPASFGSYSCWNKGTDLESRIEACDLRSWYFSSQIVEVFRRELEGGRKHIVLQVIDGFGAGDWQHNG